MTQSSYKLTDILQPLSEHSMKHASEFSQPSLGKPININNIQDMSRHILRTLFDAETKSFSGHNNRDCFYNAKTNTLVIINPTKDGNGKLYGGTVFRPAKGEQRFNKLHEIESGRDQQDLLIHQKNGIVALKPEIAKEFAQDYLQKQGQNLTTFKKAEITPQRLEANHPRQKKA
jgi:hypothetical protein